MLNSIQNNIIIIYKNVKLANLKVKPNQEVILTAPFGMSSREIEYILKKKENWIRKHLDTFNKNKQCKKELISGEDFIYLGKNYSLKIIKSKNETAKLSHRYFKIYVKDENDYHKKMQIINNWYKLRAKIYFHQIIKKYVPIINIEVNRVCIKIMKTRWGSCNPRKSYINLNLELIKKPKCAIEYVIFHELTHLLHYNHDKKFYDYLSLHMPDWKERQSKLYK